MAAQSANPGGTIPPGEAFIEDAENGKVPWPAETWAAIQRAVQHESTSLRVGAAFLPARRVSPKTTSIPPDLITNQPFSGETGNTLTANEGAPIRLNEIWTEFALTPKQVHEIAENEYPEASSAVALAKRAEQYLALAQDCVIFQGANAYGVPFFQQNVRFQPGRLPIDGGLLSLPFPAAPPWLGTGPYASSNAPITVSPLTAGSPGVLYGQNTFAAVAQGYAVLASQGQTGPYALVLNTVPYADLYAPIGQGSLVVTADRVAPLVTAGLYGTGALPPFASTSGQVPPTPLEPPYFGVLVSLGGQTMDLVTGLNARTVFMQQDANQSWRFRVLERFALRVTDPSAIVTLVFLP
jgi:uncharacterized linocin/CFP29 family protein